MVISVALMLCSCDKEGAAVFEGNYSFKTGGSLDATGKVYDIKYDTIGVDTLIYDYTVGEVTLHDTVYRYHTQNDTISSRDTVVTLHLVAESGQMHILRAEGNDMIVTMNVTGGDPVVMDAVVADGVITLNPTRRMVPVREWINEGQTYFDMTVSGSGKRYDNMVLFDLTYEGTYNYAGFEGVVTGSRVNCIATENE